MTEKAIVNRFDDGREVRDGALEKLEKSSYFEEELPVELLSSSDLERCEYAVRKCGEFTEITNLVIALGVRNIVVNKLYLEAFDSYSAYFASSEGRLGMSRQKVSRFLNSGIAYYDNRRALEAAGFRPERQFSKLEYLGAAAARYGAEEAVRELCREGGVRDFIAWARGERAERIEYTRRELEVSVTERGIAVEGRPVVKLSDVKKIVDSGAEPYLIGLDSPGEKAAITRFLKNFRSKK